MRNWLKIFLILFVFGFLVYANSLNNKFLWDDSVILGHPDMSQTKYILSQWDPYNVKYYAGYYRPLAHMVYAFCYDTFKENHWQYHLLNLFLFVLLSSLIYLLIERLTANFCLAFLTSVFFLLHPINGIMVNNIVTSALSLQLIFILGTILLVWESLAKTNDRCLYFLGLFVSFVSLFWYDMGVLTPLYLGAVILIFRQGPLKTRLMALLPFFIISFSYLVFRNFFLNGTPFMVNIALFQMTGWEYVATVFRLIGWYLVKLFFLQGIVMQWTTPVVREGLFINGLGAGTLLILLIWLFFRYSKEKIIQLAIAWILIGFAPLCLMAFMDWPIGGALIEPHWLIFSAMGFFILFAYFCLFIINRAKIAGVILLFIVFFAWGTASRAYNHIWVDQKTYAIYWQQQASQIKFINTLLADSYRQEGNFKEAMKNYKLANHGLFITEGASNNIGVLEMSQRHFKKAEEIFKMVLMMDPKSSGAYYNLGIIYFNQGQQEKAKRYFSQALAYDPFSLLSRTALATIAMKRSQYQQAIDLCLKNLDIKKDDPMTLVVLIRIYLSQKDFVSLKKYAERLINEEKDPAFLTNLGAFMTLNNIVDVAKDCYTKTLRLAPGYKNAYLDEGTLLMRMGQYDEAIRIWRQGLSLYPSDARFKKHIAQAVAMKLK